MKKDLWTVSEYRAYCRSNRIHKKHGKVRKSLAKIQRPDLVVENFDILEDEIFIPGEVKSSKNSKQIFIRPAMRSRWGFDGRPIIPFVTDSAAVKTYKKEVKPYFEKYRTKFREQSKYEKLPLFVQFTFVRKGTGIWDFNNLSEVVQDLMVECKWIEEDNSTIILPVPPLPPLPPFLICKSNPGVIIKIL